MFDASAHVAFDRGSPDRSIDPQHARQLAMSLDEEETELWKQLRRKREFAGRVADLRKQHAELVDQRRGVSTARSEELASLEHLQSELAFAQEQEQELEHDIAVLRESNRILQHSLQKQQLQRQPAVVSQSHHSDPRLGQSSSAVGDDRRQDSAQLQHEQIDHLRAHMEKLRIEKLNLQQRQQALFDRQRSAEQDRNRLLGALQDERSVINEVRLERIKLWEDRTRMERELAQLVQQSLGGGRSGRPTSPSTAVPGAAGGVRGQVTQDTPSFFAEFDAEDRGHPGGMGSSGGGKNWTSFGTGDPVSLPTPAAVDMTGVNRITGGSFPGGAGGCPPPSASPPSFGGGRIDEVRRPSDGAQLVAEPTAEDTGRDDSDWTGRVRNFRTASGNISFGGGYGGGSFKAVSDADSVRADTDADLSRQTVAPEGGFGGRREPSGRKHDSFKLHETGDIFSPGAGFDFGGFGM